MIKIDKALVESMSELNKSPKQAGELDGLSTGLKALDKYMGGLKAGKLIVIGARPGMGKSALALNWSVAAAKESSKAVIYFSYEMLYGEISMNLLRAEAKIDGRKLKSKEFDQDELKRISEAVKTLSTLKLFIEDGGGVNLNDIHTHALTIKTEYGLSMIVIDYLQLMPPIENQKNREEEMSLIIQRLKNFAVDLDIPVVLISQIMRSKDKQTFRPQLIDLRLAEPIINMADLICFIHRDDYYNPSSESKGIAELIFPKNRGEVPFSVDVRWIGSQMRFEDLSAKD